MEQIISETKTMEADAVKAAQLDPVIFQAYMCIGIILSSMVLLAIPGVQWQWTWWAFLSALLWVPGSLCSVLAVHHLGIAVAQGVWSGTIAFVSFIWGQLFTFGYNIMDLLWVTRVNRRLGIPDSAMLLTEEALGPIFDRMLSMPLVCLHLERGVRVSWAGCAYLSVEQQGGRFAHHHALGDPETKATIDLLNACDMRDQACPPTISDHVHLTCSARPHARR